MASLVDTSAWIEFFKPHGHLRIKRAVAAALEEGIVVTAAPVLVELLVGLNPARRTDARAIDRLRDLVPVTLNWEACRLAGAFGRALAGRGWRAPTVDLLLAGAAAAEGHEIWHAGDRHFTRIRQVGGPPERDLAAHGGREPGRPRSNHRRGSGPGGGGGPGAHGSAARSSPSVG